MYQSASRKSANFHDLSANFILQVCKSQKGFGPQIADPQRAIFAEGPQIFNHCSRTLVKTQLLSNGGVFRHIFVNVQE
jgi:hypothetical protein